ncbi:MAG: zinc ribbon domain-containing protein [Actinobacteria bacterium]|nr:zinc ribbon domain-containing protein [Actinomycetota bacterium]MBU1944318.1 zinc ribbon domain-containing protein [Actinomycetota bacterium]MBU2688303.1 zinc ribbon domain-containing protein [Actinomycetota bacterium]
MYCEQCGSTVPEGNRFCESCGTPLDAVDAGAAVRRARGAVPPAVAPSAVGVSSGGRRIPTWMIVLVTALSVLVAGGAVVGLVLVVGGGPTLEAKLESIDLTKANDDELDLDEVPLDVELKLTVAYTARFPEDGKARLFVKVVDSEGSNLINKSIKCKSSSSEQEYSIEYTMTSGTGKPLDVEARLELESGADKRGDSDEMQYTAEAGGGKAAEEEAEAEAEKQRQAEWDDAWQRAYDRTNEAVAAVGDLNNSAIDASGLPDYLDKCSFLLENATKIEQLVGEQDSVAFYANFVIGECNNRKAAAAAAAAAEEARRNAQPAPSPYPSDIWVVCGTCGGTGGWWMTDEMGWTGWVTCQDCGGTGYVLVPND